MNHNMGKTLGIQKMSPSSTIYPIILDKVLNLPGPQAPLPLKNG